MFLHNRHILVCAAKIAGKTARTLTKNENRLTKQKLSVDFRQPLLGGHARVGLEGTEEGSVVGKARIDVNLGHLHGGLLA